MPGTLRVEQGRGVVGILEDERSRLIDRGRARAGGRIRAPSSALPTSPVGSGRELRLDQQIAKQIVVVVAGRREDVHRGRSLHLRSENPRIADLDVQAARVRAGESTFG